MRRDKDRPALQVEHLETREVMTANTTLAAGVLTINGGPANDFIEVLRELDTNQLVVRDAGQEVFRTGAALANVNNIVINGNGGRDFLFVGPDVVQDATLNAGVGEQAFRIGGSLLIYQGNGIATLNGNNGDDLLQSSFNNDILTGNGGIDGLFAGRGLNTYTGGDDRDIVAGVQGVDVFTDPMAQDLNLQQPPLRDLLDDPFLGLPPTQEQILLKNEVDIILQRATAATRSTDGVMAIVDRSGRILGVRLEQSVIDFLNTLPNDPDNPRPGERTFMRTFFIDGAVAEARTAAFLANNQAPLTSRTFQTTSETTLTQREIEAYPSITDPTSTLRGPGFIGPLGLNNHFPRGVAFTPQVDQFAIEHTNRDSIYAVGADNILGSNNGADPGLGDVRLQERFNVNNFFIPDRIKTPGATIDPFGRAIRLAPPDSYGVLSGTQPFATARGLGTLPGGIPIFKKNSAGNLTQVGAIGVFFPGTTGFSTESNSSLSTNYDPKKLDRSIEAEFIAFAAVGGSSGTGFSFQGNVGNAPALPTGQFDLPAGRIDLVGLTLDVFGPKGNNGPKIINDYGRAIGVGGVNGALQNLIDPGINNVVDSDDPAGLDGDDAGVTTLLNGTVVPEGFLVQPHASQDGLISTEDVERMLFQGVQEALITRAAIRLPMDSNGVFVLTVTDKTGEVLGQFRMPDSTVFSIDVATAKGRNAAYYADPTALQDIDQVPGVPKGAAFTARTFRFLALPRYPEGIDGNPPGPFSQLNDDPGIDRTTAFFREPVQPQDLFYDVRGTGLQVGPRQPANVFDSVLGFNAFNPGTNFRDMRTNGDVTFPAVPVMNDPVFQNNLLNRNGIVFFPGSAPIYKGQTLIGGYGISGDGVDQDDIVTAAGTRGFQTPLNLRSDMFFFGGVRLPFAKFNRQPNINPYGSPILGNPLERRF
jgi:uncharacterized protein GlcG (DUF336 family)